MGPRYGESTNYYGSGGYTEKCPVPYATQGQIYSSSKYIHVFIDFKLFIWRRQRDHDYTMTNNGWSKLGIERQSITTTLKIRLDFDYLDEVH